MNEELGVIIPYHSEELVNETFAGSRLSSLMLSLGKPHEEGMYLKLFTDLSDNEHNEVFAIICSK